MVTQPKVDTDAPPGAVQGAIDDFQVTLEVFQGPFDLLLQLITRQHLDITEVALAQVTDEFIAYMRAFPDLSRTTEFLVVAATLLDMKAASLLPRDIADELSSREDLEARDLLFSRLLQYRAFKEAAADMSATLDAHEGSYPRDVPLEPHFAALLPELIWLTTPDELAMIAADALSATPRTVTVEHLHDPVVPVAGQVTEIAQRLRAHTRLSFTELVADAGTRAVIVSRFLALLELYRQSLIDFDQDTPTAPLIVHWVGGADAQEDTSSVTQ